MDWRNIPFNPLLDADVPSAPGIYAILRAGRVMGLPVRLEVGYVGQSIDLRRRFREHVSPWRERNPRLRQSPIYRESGWEFWFREVEEQRLNESERRLISEIQPFANILRYES